MVATPCYQTNPIECFDVVASDGPLQLWFPDLTTDPQYTIFLELTVGRFTGLFSWQRLDTNPEEYAFHLDNW